MGQLVGNLGSAAGAAKSSLLWSGLSTGLGVLGNISKGTSQAQQYAYQAAVTANNATITRNNADAASMAAGYEESVLKTKSTLDADTGTVRAAANGVDVGLGAPVAVKDSALSIGALDAAVAHFNAARTAYGMEAEAANLDAQANLYTAAAKNSKRAILPSVAATLIGGATSISGKLSAYQQSGALGPSRKDQLKGLY